MRDWLQLNDAFHIGSERGFEIENQQNLSQPTGKEIGSIAVILRRSEVLRTRYWNSETFLMQLTDLERFL
jgi:hypothetical protein